MSAHAVLLKCAKRLPRSPGVYRFYGAADVLLYVGKANSLRARVMTYFQSRKHMSPRTRLLVNGITRLDYTLTPTEADALLLEQEQIKGRKPRYNVLFRDDKSYPYLRLSSHATPRIALHRGPPSPDCYGPFPNGWAVRESIRVLQRVFHLRTCTDSVFANRTRPCLLHQIDQCSAPCVDHVDACDYASDVAGARAFLAGRNREVVERLSMQMEGAAAGQNYEKAARLRDSIKALAEVRHVSAVTGGAHVADFIGMHQDEAGTAVRLAAVRGGRLVGEIDYFPANSIGADPDEVLLAFLSHHYARHCVPARVVVHSKEAPAALALLLGDEKTTVISSPRGAELERLAMVAANAAQALATHVGARARATIALAELGAALAIDAPARIDCFDVSHSMGEEASASCVACVDGVLEPRRYLRFRLRQTAAGDDYAGMREALTRRYRKVASDTGSAPDLIVVDGGVGQVKSALEALVEVGLTDVPVLGIAKGAARKPGKETLITGSGELLELASHRLAFRLLQRIRDEAHRFALAGHRRRREHKRQRSVLEDIEGIGPARRRQLINAFGGLQGLKCASPRDLSRTSGVGSELARRIYLALHS